MDFGTFSGIFSAVLIVFFIALIVWAYTGNKKAYFDEAARSILDDERSPKTVNKE